jgi:hypothetical protein
MRNERPGPGSGAFTFTEETGLGLGIGPEIEKSRISFRGGHLSTLNSQFAAGMDVVLTGAVSEGGAAPLAPLRPTC